VIQPPRIQRLNGKDFLVKIWLLMGILLSPSGLFAYGKIVRDLTILVSDQPQKAKEDAIKALADATISDDHRLALTDILLQAHLNLSELKDAETILDTWLKKPNLRPYYRAAFLIHKADAQIQKGDYSDAHSSFSEAYAMIAETDEPELKLRYFFLKGVAEFEQNLYMESSQSFQKALDLAKDRRRYYEISSYLAFGLAMRNRLDDALRIYEEANHYYQKAGLSFLLAVNLYNMGYLYEHHAEYQQAIEPFEKSRSLSQSLNDPAGQYQALLGLANVTTLLGSLETAQRHLDEAFRFEDLQEDAFHLATAYFQKARLCHLRKSEARSCLATIDLALNTMPKQGSFKVESRFLREKSTILQYAGLYQEATETLKAVMELHEQHAKKAQNELLARHQAQLNLSMAEQGKELLQKAHELSQEKLKNQRLSLVLSLILTLFSSYLAIRIWKVKRREKLKAQRTMNRLILDKNHTLGQLQKLVFEHQVAMIDQGTLLEGTMPVGEAEACVLCFDIIRSTKIEPSVAKPFFQDLFSSCHAIMMEHYQPEGLVASAYRIKEMGDGFLCSIGFPFRCPEDCILTFSVQLAERFHQAFVQARSRYGLDHGVECAMGLAHGTVEAYFPKSGVKNYDLFGRALVMATRYESMRKHLFPAVEGSSFLIIPWAVYERLSPTLQARFATVDLRAAGLKVRDDDQATHLFVRQWNQTIMTGKIAAS
jgi:tetratricopeptide (TPR) repeat protein